MIATAARMPRLPIIPSASHGPRPGGSLAVLALLSLSSAAAAADLGTLRGFDVRLDTGLRVSLGLRTASQEATLLDAVNADDGDRAFGRGFISERLDVTTRLDATRGDLGFELGADGWYDAAYHGPDANRSRSTFNPVTVANDAFPADTRRLMGGEVELGPAYVRDKFDLGGLPVSVRIGRQTLLWGESLFFAQDGIAGAQAPVDLIKQASQPLIQARELYLPVTQADVRVKLPWGLSLEAYDQVEWRRDRIPGVASYFSTSDILDTGGQRVFTGDGGAVYRGRDETPSGARQFGVALRHDGGTFGFGLYALRYDAKLPEAEAGGSPGTYRLAFPAGIGLLGLSADTYAGDGTLSGEVSYRRDLPLVSRFQPLAPSLPGTGSAFKVAGGPVQAGFATGQVLQGLASYETLLPRGRLWGEATLQAEIAASEVLAVQSNPGGRLPGTTRSSLAWQAEFTPTWYQVVRDLNLSAPMGLELGMAGRSSVDAGQEAGAGSVTLGVTAAYRTVWLIGLSLTEYVGSPKTQLLVDRGFAALSLARTF